MTGTGRIQGNRTRLVVVLALLASVINVGSCKSDYDRLKEQAPQKLAAQTAIQKRYAPNSELLRMVRNPEKPFGWEVNETQLLCKDGECWEIVCYAFLKSGPESGLGTPVAKWLVNTKTLDDTPDSDAQRLFTRRN